MSQLYGYSFLADNGASLDWTRYRSSEWFLDIYDQYNWTDRRDWGLSTWPNTQWSMGTPQLAPYRNDIAWDTLDVIITGASVPWKISGVTRDRTAAPLGGCTVKCFRVTPAAQADTLAATTVSDGNGVYTVYPRDFDTTGTNLYYLVAYLAGSPDVSGTTANNIVGA